MKNLEGMRYKGAECNEDEHVGMQRRGGDRWKNAAYAKKNAARRTDVWAIYCKINTEETHMLSWKKYTHVKLYHKTIYTGTVWSKNKKNTGRICHVDFHTR